MIQSNQLLVIYIFYIFLCFISFVGLIWLTQFSFNAKVASVNIPNFPKVSAVEGVSITDSNLTTSKIAVVSLWIQILGTFLFAIFKISTVFLNKTS